MSEAVESEAGVQVGTAGPTALSAGWRAACLTVLGVDVLLLILHMVATGPWLDLPEFAREMFNLGLEGNVPTWWASILWLLVSLTAFVCLRLEWRAGRGLSPVWLLMGCVFLGASIDEVATIHEEVGSFLQRERTWSPLLQLWPAGVPGSPWIAFYAPIIVLLLAVFLIFLWRRFARWPVLRLLLVMAVQCYAVAVVLDHYQGLDTLAQEKVSRMFGLRSPDLERATVAAEETLENLGSSLFFLVLLAHAQLAIAGVKAAGAVSASEAVPDL